MTFRRYKGNVGAEGFTPPPSPSPERAALNSPMKILTLLKFP